MELRVKWVLALLLAGTTARGATVAEAVAAATQTPPFDKALWFVLVEEEDGTIVADHNGDKLAIPASVRKLFSAATAAECIGIDDQLTTELWLDGEDVVLKGGGDPSFGSDRYGHDREGDALAPFVTALRHRGIRKVRDVIADVSLFDRVTLPYQWKLGNVVSDVAAPVDALAWSENDIGSYAVASAGHFAADAFREALIGNGIEVSGTIRVETEPRSWGEQLSSVRSPFVRELLATVLKPSHNLFAEMLYKLSSAGGEKPASYEQSREGERMFLVSDVGINGDSFRFVDGSGLAPDDLVTPVAIIRMLRWMNHPSRRGTWWPLLAEPGAAEGTLRNRLKPLATRLRAKTGTVAGVSSLAGIIEGRDGSFRYFAVIVNHHVGSSSAAARLIDEIVDSAGDF